MTAELKAILSYIEESLRDGPVLAKAYCGKDPLLNVNAYLGGYYETRLKVVARGIEEILEVEK